MINFLKYRKFYFLISLLVLVPGIYSLIVWGLKPSIDFVGGTVIEVQSTKFNVQNFEEEFKNKGIEIESANQDNDTVTIRTKPIDRSKWEEVKFALDPEATTSATPSGILTAPVEEATLAGRLVETRFESVGPILGRELLEKTAVAAVIAIVGILLYIAWAFKDFKFAFSAVLALFHDVLVVLGVFSLLGHFFGIEVDVLFVTAILTTMSFSVHDTIVVFDRIRESQRKENLPLEKTINKSLTETMVRSLNNSMTIIFMLLALVLLGGDTIRWFVVQVRTRLHLLRPRFCIYSKNVNLQSKSSLLSLVLQ
jgi:preprotein translocase subunit SecF